MDAFDVIRTRRSVRAYLPKKIPDEILYAILEAGHYAPAAGNITNWRFLVVESEEKKKAIVKAALGQEWIAKAPVVLIACSEPDAIRREYGERAKKLYSVQNVAAAIENILLAAHNFGIASCWVGAFTEANLRKEFEIPDDTEIHAIVPLGYAAEKPSHVRRAATADVVYFEKWGNSDREISKPKTLGEHIAETRKKITKKVKSAVGKTKKRKKK